MGRLGSFKNYLLNSKRMISPQTSPQSAGGEVASPWLRCDHQPEALAQHTKRNTLTRTESNRTRQLEDVADYLATAAARQLLAASVLRGCKEPAFLESLSELETT